jgi:membrane protease YdiL (CAAX protease family)
MSTRPGSRQFYARTAALAGTWAIGGIASGGLRRGEHVTRRERQRRRPVPAALATALAAFGVFYAGAGVARRVPRLDRAVGRALSFAEAGDEAIVLAIALANGVGEEIFFRGALYAAVGDRHGVAASTAAYTLSTASTRNPAMVIAGGVMGTLFALQRRAYGGIRAPIVTHIAWSALMIRCLRRRPRST